MLKSAPITLEESCSYAHAAGLIASGSEDRSLKIWKCDIFCILNAWTFIMLNLYIYILSATHEIRLSYGMTHSTNCLV